MRNLQTFLADYGESHQNPVNQWVHILCVPAIFVSTLGLFWLLPLGQWLGLEALPRRGGRRVQRVLEQLPEWIRGWTA